MPMAVASDSTRDAASSARHIRRRALRERPRRLKRIPLATRATAAAPSLVAVHFVKEARVMRPPYSRHPRLTRNQLMPRVLRRLCPPEFARDGARTAKGLTKPVVSQRIL